MLIRTKIIATVGPASGDHETLLSLARGGCDVFRVNFSHGTADQRQQFLDNIRRAETEVGHPLAVMADLCGPKIRVGIMAGEGAVLEDGATVTIQREPVIGTAGRFCTTLAELVDCVGVGQSILLDDGKLRLEVIETAPPTEFRCRVIRGGRLTSGKGVNLPQTQLALSALTEKDRRDVEWIAGREFDYVALSFVRTAGDVHELRSLLQDRGCGAHICSKIEKPQALENIEAIIDASDAVMVARGDLGVEMDLPAVPTAQKRIAALCQSAGKPCIIATQMLESMTASPTPTRAEVSDVANAVLDCADAVMLSGETAVGQYPVAAVEMMNRIVAEVQAYADSHCDAPAVACQAAPVVTALARAARQVLSAIDVAAVAVYTATGATARLMAKSRLPCPILAISHDQAVLRRMVLYYGVAAVRQPAPEHTRDVLARAAKFAKAIGAAASGDRIIVISGRPIGQAGSTNSLVVHTV